ncbi:MAG: hypothetical protein K6G84_07195 [Lachnospiraceae bacterium]|nr:hypothetical protein [Lachnospiraceae bacterium]
MLNYPQYHRKTYDELFEEALHLIPLYSKEWTNFNMSDPAITVLENFTAFQALQMEKMDTISEETDLALLSLAGFKPKKENRATVYVTSENREKAGTIEHFPKGKKFHASEMTFEVPEDTDYVYGQIIGVLGMGHGRQKDFTDMLVSYNVKQGIYPFGRVAEAGNALYLVLNALPKSGKDLVLYVQPSENDIRRDAGEEIGKIYADIEVSILTGAGYEVVETKDMTASFLSRGLIVIKVPQGAIMTDFNGYHGYVIKFYVKESRYDVPPKINIISAFLTRLVQQDTKAIVSTEKESSDDFAHHISYGKYTVHASDEVMRYRRVGFVHGFDEERFALTPFSHIVPESLEFVVEFKRDDGTIEYRLSRTMKEFSYHLENEDSELVVDVPGEAVGGELLIASLALYEGDNGNIIADNSFEDGFYNPANGFGGRFKEKTADVIKRFSKDLKTHRTMVNEEDYENIIKNDRRMLIDKVHAWRVSDHEVHITAKPFSEEERPKLTDLYKDLIYEDIDAARLLTTKVVIQNPGYVGVRVKCTLKLKRFMSVGSNIKETLKECIRKEILKCNFGAKLSFRKLYNILRSMEEIELVDDFSILPESYDGVEMQGNDIKAFDGCMIYPSHISVEIMR